MKLTPYDFQMDAVEALFDYFIEREKPGNPIVVMPTGTGKSLTIAEFLERLFGLYRGQRVMVLTHVKELIRQNYKELKSQWPFAPAGIYSSGLKLKQVCPITIAGIGSVVNCPEIFGKVDLVIIDECHLLSPNEGTNYQRFINALKKRNPLLKVIGFSATPYRLGQGMLTDPYKGKPALFSDICYDISGLAKFNWLIEEGYLAPLVPRPTESELDVSAVHTVNGEYNQTELQQAVDKEEITCRAVEEICKEGENRHHWLIFGTGIQHCEHIKGMLESYGIPTGCIHSEMEEEREEVLAKFQSGELRAVVNPVVLTVGYNFKALDLIADLAPTQSVSRHVQKYGRGTRPFYAPGFDLATTEGRLAGIANSQKHNCLVLDFAGNVRRLGPINDPQTPRKKGKGGGGDAPARLCEKCNTYAHASAKVCPHCGEAFPPPRVKFGAHAGTEELIRGSKPDVRIFPVAKVTYSRHKKQGAPMSIRVGYICGPMNFTEYLGFEHEGFARKKARDWWRARTDGEEPPETVEDAMQRISGVNTPTHVRVWVNLKYPRLMDHCFDGSAFNTKEPGGVALPQVQTEAPAVKFSEDLIDEDVPF